MTFFAEFCGKRLSTVDTVKKKVGIRVELHSLVFIAFSFIDCKSNTIFDLSNLIYFFCLCLVFGLFSQGEYLTNGKHRDQALLSV